MPDADRFIIEAFMTLGTCRSNGYGMVAIGWDEVAAFNKCSTYKLEDWQNELLITMSRTYCSWLSKGKDVGCFSPWDSTAQDDMLRHNEYITNKIKERAKAR